ncbi:uncharacterized protein BDV14DRAFT_202367 [Aspergillus stella-maris]|uniref:uncharacterized protein n=1 Tax=Aspergillus stella-maris TaxID=1810926 RepID=UPI003CCDEA24
MLFNLNIMALAIAALAATATAAPQSPEEICLRICYPEETPCPAPSYPKQQGTVCTSIPADPLTLPHIP